MLRTWEIQGLTPVRKSATLTVRNEQTTLPKIVLIRGLKGTAVRLLNSVKRYEDMGSGDVVPRTHFRPLHTQE
jgi:hypothetical protein